jgi:soluble lytic murein transglycosylase-like protein
MLLPVLLVGCRQAEKPGRADSAATAAVSPAAGPPAVDTRAIQPRAPQSPIDANPPPPSAIPREAMAYRDNFIRIWRFYFAYAESPTIGFAQVHQESHWKASARSVYASGLAQFTPATAADYSRLLPPEIRAQCSSTAGCPTDPTWALYALSLYDYNLHRSYAWAETADDRWRIALAAYNGGAGWLQKERARAANSRRWADIAKACMRSAAACKENHDYPIKIMGRWLPLYQLWLGL